jgi:hypothetical protein
MRNQERQKRPFGGPLMWEDIMLNMVKIKGRKNFKEKEESN